jgi:8-oxo-dGTP pyrophosphatase MutT (NUDIX family)
VTFTDAVERLEAAFTRELPGEAAQDRLAPIPRREWPAGINPARIRNAAGLLLVYPWSEKNATVAKNDLPLRASRPLRSSLDAHLVLTVRADTLGRHGGQVSLPGGVVDPGETFEQAALREAHEEIALSLDGVRVLGALTPLDIPVSGFRLHPIVAIRSSRPTLRPADGEVARILELDLEELLDPKCVHSTERVRDGRVLTIPAFHVDAHGGHEIWGATAMVLAEFLALLGWASPPSDSQLS